MPAKRQGKKVLPKRLIHSAATNAANKDKMVTTSTSSNQSTEAAIVRQFHQIQKGYSRLMIDVAKELDLVKIWLGSQALSKRKELKSRITERLMRN